MTADCEEIWVDDAPVKRRKKGGSKENTVIYIMIDPRNSEVRYIGKTHIKLQTRFDYHMSEKKRSLKGNWIKSLRAISLQPSIAVIEDLGLNPGVEVWQEAERFWISYFRFMGARLTNLTDGGEGLSGLIFSDDHRKRIGEAKRGMGHTPESRAKMSASHKKLPFDHLRKLADSQRGKPLSPEHIKALGKPWLGRKHTPETKAKMSKAALGRKVSPETRARMSKAQKGVVFSLEHRTKISMAQIRRHSEKTKTIPAVLESAP